MTATAPLIIPVEEQVRELDAKLLLACCVAESGRPALLGSRHVLHLRCTALPRGIYFAKSFRRLSLRMFGILRELGHEIVACDEEALLPFPDALYFERRVDAETLGHVSQLFAWGPESAALFTRCPGYDGAPIEETGHPRGDLLRPELRPYFAEATNALRDRFGDFLLLNTNFGTINHAVPKLGWLRDPSQASVESISRAYVTGLSDYRKAIFGHFQRLVPALAKAFPKQTLVIRPHPVESHVPWLRLAGQHANVRVVHEGNVLPWLMASRTLIHNGCTTSLEAFGLGEPAIAYLPERAPDFEIPLPNELGQRACDEAELIDRVRALLGGAPPPADPAQEALFARHVCARTGPLASDRIRDALPRHAGPAPGPVRRAGTGAHVALRRTVKRVRGAWFGDENATSYQERRFPPLSAESLQARVDALGATLERFDGLRVRALRDQIIEITPGR